MYLIGIKKGVYPCGNSGTLITRYKSIQKIKETAKRFADMYNLDEVYYLKIYPKELCEMSNTEFVNYVRQNGVRYIG